MAVALTNVCRTLSREIRVSSRPGFHAYAGESGVRLPVHIGTDFRKGSLLSDTRIAEVSFLPDFYLLRG